MAGAAEVALGEVLVVLADEAGGFGRAGDVFGQGGPELLRELYVTYFIGCLCRNLVLFMKEFSLQSN